MRKIMLGLFALTMLTASAAFADGGKKKVNTKTKTECPKGCPDGKHCHKNGPCPDKPGCVCH